MGTCGTAHISTVSCARVRGAGQRPEHRERRVLGGGGARHAPLRSVSQQWACGLLAPGHRSAGLFPERSPPGERRLHAFGDLLGGSGVGSPVALASEDAEGWRPF